MFLAGERGVPISFLVPALFSRRIALVWSTADNGGMVLHGRVQNGVVVFEGNPALPEGMPVVVSFAAQETGSSSGKKRVELPLVASGRPGSLQLSGEQIAEILD